MTQKRFNALAILHSHINALTILHSHKDLVDKLLLAAIGNDFVGNIRIDETILEPFQALTFTKVYSETPFSKNSYHIETSRVDLHLNQLTSFYMIGILKGISDQILIYTRSNSFIYLIKYQKEK